MRLAFFGDVVGRSGREGLAQHLPGLRRRLGLDFVMVNAENAAAGFGITESTAKELFEGEEEEVAKKVGRSRAVVANALRLLKLAAPIQAALRDGRLSVGHAKVILGLVDPALQKSACDRVLAAGMSVRQTEDLVAALQNPKPEVHGDRSQVPAPSRDLHVVDIENKLRERFAAKVALRYKAGKGSVEVRFSDDNELNRVLEVMGLSLD